jgi:hypothetical protein
MRSRRSSDPVADAGATIATLLESTLGSVNERLGIANARADEAEMMLEMRETGDETL